MYVYVPCSYLRSAGPEEDIRFHGNGATDGCELPHECGNQIQVPWKSSQCSSWLSRFSSSPFQLLVGKAIAPFPFLRVAFSLYTKGSLADTNYITCNPIPVMTLYCQVLECEDSAARVCADLRHRLPGRTLLLVFANYMLYTGFPHPSWT